MATFTCERNPQVPLLVLFQAKVETWVEPPNVTVLSKNLIICFLVTHWMLLYLKRCFWWQNITVTIKMVELKQNNNAILFAFIHIILNYLFPRNILPLSPYLAFNVHNLFFVSDFHFFFNMQLFIWWSHNQK